MYLFDSDFDKLAADPLKAVTIYAHRFHPSDGSLVLNIHDALRINPAFRVTTLA
jgi:hypothetical protein